MNLFPFCVMVFCQKRVYNFQLKLLCLRDINQKLLSRHPQRILTIKGVGDLGKSIKKGKFVSKIFFQKMLNEVLTDNQSAYLLMHGILSPHEDGGQGHFSGLVGGLPFQMDNGGTPLYGGSHNQGFPWVKSSMHFLLNWQCRTQVCKSEFNKLSQRSLQRLVTSAKW